MLHCFPLFNLYSQLYYISPYLTPFFFLSLSLRFRVTLHPIVLLSHVFGIWHGTSLSRSAEEWANLTILECTFDLMRMLSTPTQVKYRKPDYYVKFPRCDYLIAHI